MNYQGAAKTKKGSKYGFTVFDLLNYIAFGMFTFICIYPFYFIIINTISSNVLSANGEILFIPRQIQFSNYVQILKLPGMLQAAFISVSRTVLGTVLPVLTSAFLGFMFTQEKMWARKVWYRFILVTMYFSAGLIPWYITMMNLGLVNNFLAYIIPALVQPFSIIMVKTYVESTPKALQDAAEIDGAGTLAVFWRVIFPIITPILATISIFSSVGQWNSFTDTLLLMTNKSLYTLQYILYMYINQSSSLAALIRGSQSINGNAMKAALLQTPTSIRMTVTVIVIFPILMVYPFFQKYFLKGLLIGAIKG
jgi:putative aldouronate transport system permease protein